jgi:hypothetical protein
MRDLAIVDFIAGSSSFTQTANGSETSYSSVLTFYTDRRTTGAVVAQAFLPIDPQQPSITTRPKGDPESIVYECIR